MNITDQFGKESKDMSLNDSLNLMASIINKERTLQDLSINELKELKYKIDIEIYRKSR